MDPGERGGRQAVPPFMREQLDVHPRLRKPIAALLRPLKGGRGIVGGVEQKDRGER